jgi:uncharacterized protein YecT (DUF1311 family)
VKPADAEAASGGRFGFSATHATILVALLGAIGTATAAIYTARENLRLEDAKQVAAAELARQDFETKLIFRAIEGSDSAEERIRNLKFFLEAGFLRDPEGKIKKLDPAKFPSKVTPSFDCLKDTDPAARVICSNSGLSTQDGVMASLFVRLKAGLGDSAEEQNKLVAEQRQWLLLQRNACVDATEPVSCMAEKYDQRIRYLRDRIAAQAATTR